MADTIPQHFATEFSTNWIHRVQQSKARLDAYVVDENFAGERKRYDRLSSQSSQERTERKAPTPITDPGNDSRWCYRRTFDLANVLAEEDARNLAPLVLPNSDYVKSHSMAYHRDCDSVAISAALGSVITGEAGTTVTAYAGGAIAAGGTGLTIAKLRTARELLNLSDVLEEEAPVVLAISPQQVTNLLATTEVTSADYNTVKALVAGQIDTFMGFKFVMSNRLSKVSTTRSCVAWVKGAIKRVKGGMRTSIDRLPEKSNATQIYSSWDLSAARVYDEGVVQIDCTEV